MKSSLKNWVTKNKEVLGFQTEPHLEDISSGESNHTFKLKIKDSAKKYVIRTSRHISEDRIKHESEVLDFLEKLQIERVPQKIYYKEETSLKQPILVETYIGEKDITVNELSKKQIKQLAQMLAKIHSIDSKKYNKHMNETKPIKTTLGYEFREDFIKYSKEPLEKYERLAENPDKRISKFYHKQKELLREAKNTEDEIKWKMSHGDLSNNLRVTNTGNICLVDWELARPGIPRFELVYLFKHSSIDDSKKEKFLQEYRRIREIPETAEKWSNKRKKFLAFNDMIWAAQRKEICKKEGKNHSKYEKMFEKRLKELQELYNDKS